MTGSVHHRFRLFVAGDAPNSLRARHNLERLCRQYLGTAYEIEVVDVLTEPQRVLMEGILITPFLVQLEPSIARLAGDLSDEAAAVATMGLR